MSISNRPLCFKDYVNSTCCRHAGDSGERCRSNSADRPLPDGLKTTCVCLRPRSVIPWSTENATPLRKILSLRYKTLKDESVPKNRTLKDESVPKNRNSSYQISRCIDFYPADPTSPVISFAYVLIRPMRSFTSWSLIP